MKFNNIVKELVLEQGRYEILLKTYTTPKKSGDKTVPAKMTKEELFELVKADPTTRADENTIKKAGEYSNWIIRQYLKLQPEEGLEPGSKRFEKELKEKQKMFFEDLYKTTEDLIKFHRFKTKLPVEKRDINSLTIETLYNEVKDFDIEIAKTSKTERKTAKVHPGAELVYDGEKWDVFKIKDKTELGREAACHYGGNNQETRWCTSSPGYDSHFKRYIGEGPLYVLVDKTDENLGQISGLPKHRYQFHFPSNQFMDVGDKQIELINFLNSQEPGLKEFFKPEFMKGILRNDGKHVSVEYPRDSASKFIALYGFEEFFDTLPKDIVRFDFVKTQDRSSEEFNLKLPPSIGKFKQLDVLHLDGVIEELPDEVGQLSNLQWLSIPNNKKLKSLPKGLANLPNIVAINITNSNPNLKIPRELVDLENDESREPEFNIFR